MTKKKKGLLLLLCAVCVLLFSFKKKPNAHVEIGDIQKPPTLDQGSSWYGDLGGLFGNAIKNALSNVGNDPKAYYEQSQKPLSNGLNWTQNWNQIT